MILTQCKNPFFFPFSNGIYYVETFFVLTGFLIARSFLNNPKQSLLDYYKARFVRLYPLLLVAAALDCWFPVKGLDNGPAEGVWKNLAFVSSLYAILPESVNQPIGKR
jgi:peptidoglycan/LPS O-acetylase OafA/YrhL